MYKRTLSILVALFLVLSLLPNSSAAIVETKSQFSDMPDNWATEALESAVENGLLIGDKGKIMPDDPLTRAQMATIIVRAFAAIEEGDLSAYTDIKSTDWFADSIAKAFKMGVMQGYNGKMNPNDEITREQAFAVLVRALRLTPAEKSSIDFDDDKEISEWAKGEIYALVNAGYVQGYNGKLKPQATISRAEFAQVMHNIIKQYINKGGVYTKVVPGNVMVNAPGVTLKNLTINGDLIIGDGVGDGEVKLENVTLKGSLVARGGGLDSIVIVGGSVEGKIIISKVDGQIRVSVEGGAEVEVVVVDDGKDDIIIEGDVGTIEVAVPGVPVLVQNATVDKITVTAEGPADLTLAKDTVVKDIEVEPTSEGTTLAVEGRVTNIDTSAPSTAVSGSGTVGQVTTKEGADNSTITTPNTRINNEKAPGVTAGGGKEVAIGENVTNNYDGSNVVAPPPIIVPPTDIAISAVSISGTVRVGETLTATPTPSGASVSYQWKISDSSDGTYTNITDATSKTYIPTEAGKWLKVEVSGTGNYTGTQTSTAVGPVEEVPVPVTYAISFLTAEDAESLAGASIKVYSDANRTSEVADYSAVEAGTYYYTITKDGFDELQGTVIVTDKDEEVEIALVETVVVPVTVTGIAIKTEPAKIAYTEGEKLQLAGLVVTLTKSDSSTEDVAFADFVDEGITVSLAEGLVLTVTDTKITITHTESTKAVDQAITVNLKEEVSAITITAKVNGQDYVAGSVLPNEVGITVTLITDTEGADIYYTLDESEPTANSTQYNGAFTVNAPSAEGGIVTIKAIGIKENYTDSAVATLEVEFGAVPVVKHTVTFDKNGGNTNADPTTMEVVDGGKVASLPTAPTREGYSFKSWNTKADGSGNAFTTDTEVIADITVYAVWEAIEYKIVYHLDGGTNSEDNPGGYNIEADTIILADASKVGHSFDGWYDAEIEGNKVTKIYKGSTGNKVLYARFTINTYTVTFEDHDGSVLVTQTVEYGSNATAPTEPTREGYKFDKWDKAFTNVTEDLIVIAEYTIKQYTITFDSNGGSEVDSITQDCGTTVTTPVEPSRNGYTFDGWDQDIPTTMPAENLTITAKWKAIEYDITYYLDGGINDSSNPVKYTVETETITLKDASKDNYGFNGWYDAVSGGNEILEIEKGSIGNITLYARWTHNKYKVVFKDHDGSVLITQTVEHGKDATPPADPTREGFKFDKWDNDFTNVTSDLTVKAVYAINTYTVTFQDYDEKVLDTQTVEHGSDAIAPAEPTREGFKFDKWDKAFTNVTGDLTITAIYMEESTLILTFDLTPVDATVEVKKASQDPEEPIIDPVSPGIYHLQEGIYYSYTVSKGELKVDGFIHLVENTEVRVALVILSQPAENNYATGDTLTFTISGFKAYEKDIKVGMPIYVYSENNFAADEKVLTEMNDDLFWLGNADVNGVLTVTGTVREGLPNGALHVTLPDHGYGLESAIRLENESGSVQVGVMPEEPVVIGITVKTPPHKVTYVEGDALELDGLEVTVTMSDGEENDFSFADFTEKGITVSPENGTILNISDSKVTITHTASNKTVDQPITVTEAGITVSKLDKNYYDAGDTLSFTISGLNPSEEVKVGMPIYIGGGGDPWASGENVLTDNMHKNGGLNWVGESDADGKLIVSGTVEPDLPYGELHITLPGYDIPINDAIRLEDTDGQAVYVGVKPEVPVVIGITVKTPPHKVTYVEGDALELDELEVTVTMSDNTVSDFIFADFGKKGITVSIADGTLLTITDTKVTITHTASGKTVDLQITVDKADITVSKLDKNYYAAGDTLSFTISGLNPSEEVMVGMPIYTGEEGWSWASGEHVLTDNMEDKGDGLYWFGTTDVEGKLLVSGTIGPNLPYGALNITLPDYEKDDKPINISNTIALQGNDGQPVYLGEHTVAFHEDGIDNQKVPHGEKVTKPEDPEDRTRGDGPHGPEWEYFLAWYTERPQEDQEWNESKLYNFDDPVTKSIDLYARWEDYGRVFFVFNDASPGGIEIFIKEFTGENQHGVIDGLTIEDFKLSKKVNEGEDELIEDLILKGEDGDYIISLQVGSFEDGLYKLVFDKMRFVSGVPFFGTDEDGYFEVNAEKSARKAAIKPTWNMEKVEADVSTELPDGVPVGSYYKITMGITYTDKDNWTNDDKTRTVTTYLNIPMKEGPPPEESEEEPVPPEELGITLYYPFIEDNVLTYESERSGEIAIGKKGHGLSEADIDEDVIFYLVLDQGVEEREIRFYIWQVDAVWKNVAYGEQELSINLPIN